LTKNTSLPYRIPVIGALNSNSIDRLVNMTLKKIPLNCATVVLSVGVGLLLCEFMARLVLNPSDFLSLDMVPDKVLGAVPSPAALAGFDKLGYRNRQVPETVDIVAIGDSHTYGNAARMEDSWPYVLARLTGRRIYNMGMGGYGPNQYYYLLKNKALKLKPRIIICGLYMGDDFENAFTITYGLEYWSYLRQLSAENVDFNIWKAPPAASGLQTETRAWLSRHSVVYQILFHASFFGRLQGEMQIKEAPQLDRSATSLIIPEKNIAEAFHPIGMLTRINQQDPNVLEGMRLTFELLKQMKELCQKNNVQFVVVVIPAKEMVFANYFQANASVPLSDVVDEMAANERLALKKTFQFLSESAIQYVDVLPALTASAQDELYARTANDMHPNKNGYRVIAEAIAASMKQFDSDKQPTNHFQ
jgi:SGNH hydrolase-like domain, acetyltransferase AlgX